MITEKQKDKLMEMIKAYGVDESVRGYYIGSESPFNEERQAVFCKQKIEQIETCLTNMVGIERRD